MLTVFIFKKHSLFMHPNYYTQQNHTLHVSVCCSVSGALPQTTAQSIQ